MGQKKRQGKEGWSEKEREKRTHEKKRSDALRQSHHSNVVTEQTEKSKPNTKPPNQIKSKVGFS